MGDIAVVTGASGGIGRAVAKAIHEKSEGGLTLCLHYNGNRKAADAAAAEIPGSFLVQADLAQAEGRKRLLDEVVGRGAPYVLVNSAGVDKPHEPALQIQESSFDSIVNANLRAPAFLMRDFGKEMAAAGSGVIVNVSSVLARKALVGSALYRASKAALEALTLQFASELGPRGVRVNAVVPGFIETPMTAGIAQPIKDKMLSQIALGGFGEAAAVAQAVCALIENDYLNGALLNVDGGMTL
ncbi:MAG: SDR family oxidoreductase [Elusimicrobia bacterium]|nr:SDR family oxidoreductase [Elusimicrobiota bacterium]MDE2236890.1 SDR family oxidoreductase [Elusimicrobiota bacterium]MDE2424981.1 SDR family oxidoreductase [Elusimicrobiota bacterium]